MASHTFDPESAAALLSAMANAKRLTILTILVQGENAVGALAAQVSLSQSALSQHLGKLRAMGLVSTRRDAQTVFYSCKSERVKAILDLLEQIGGGNKGQSPPAKVKPRSIEKIPADPPSVARRLVTT
ncbi:metalloregulator ArsR/SmtB family transcription factor [Rhizobium sp. LjRoot30]|uniref:ArsR/SmtB family transcription factor n=1 Tax=Rhizobium sp. LjRoot30 TaxID=3342320 RepID=UPI003ED1153A